MKKKKKGIVDYFLILAMVLSFGVFTYASYHLIIIQNEYKKGEQTYEHMQEYVHPMCR